MVTRDLTRDIIERAYEARRSGNVDAIIALCHPNAKFEIVGFSNQSAPRGSAQGHSELRVTLAELIAAFEFVERNILTVLVEGNQAAVHSRVKLRFVPKSKTITTDLLDLWTFQDGKVIQLLEFVDTALVNDLTA
jgi:ketosteroid isomerase-like protein